MKRNQPHWPRQWLMTDERIGDSLWEALAALPEGAGVVFRHYATPKDEREALARRVAEICDDCRFTLAIAGDVALARSVGAALVHNPDRDSGLLPVSRAAHSLEEARLAVNAGASMIFLAPMFETRSHPDREPLSRAVARQIVAACPVPVIALGGMNQARFDELKSDGFHGWAGIDAWVGSRRRYDR